LYSGGPTLKF